MSPCPSLDTSPERLESFMDQLLQRQLKLINGLNFPTLNYNHTWEQSITQFSDTPNPHPRNMKKPRRALVKYLKLSMDIWRKMNS
jgi:hypothetical protein